MAPLIFRYRNSIVKTLTYFSSSRSELPVGGGNSLIRFEPEFFNKSSRLIVPVNFTRYVVDNNVSIKKTKEYDYFLNALFERTSFFLDAGIVTSVDVLATGDLQKINWRASLVDTVEQHFFSTHKDMLQRQSNVYGWDEWIAIQGNKVYEEKYQEIVNQSQPGSGLHELMVRVQKNVKINSTIEQSLEYQRREYAAILIMNHYTHFVYTGDMPITWPYLCKQYNNLPFFSRVKLENHDDSINYIKRYDAEQITHMLISNIKQVLTGKNFPPEDKKKFIDDIVGLIYAYGPSENKNKVKLPTESIIEVEPLKITGKKI